jgi:hypothetical protein
MLFLHILKNPCYKDCIIHKGQVCQGQYKAIISEYEWEQVQEIFKRHGRGEPKRNNMVSSSFFEGNYQVQKLWYARESEFTVWKKEMKYCYYV